MSSRSAVFLGSKNFGLTILKTLISADPSVVWRVIHPNDIADDRSILGDFEALCVESDMGFDVVARAQNAHEIIAEVRPDIVFVCGWYFLLPSSLLTSGIRFMGIHNSLLPKYRGGAPLVWSMINGEEEVGSSLFEIAPGMDDGPVYFQVSVNPRANDGIGDVLSALEAKFVGALPQAWPQIISGDIRGREQVHSSATYCGQRMAEDGQIDWYESAQRVHDFIRAQSHPYPGAFSAASDRVLRFWKSSVFPSPYFGTPGQILLRSAERVTIACGGGTAIDILQATDPLGNSNLMDIFGSLKMRLGFASSHGEI